MKGIQIHTIFLSVLLLSSFTVFEPISDSFASEITYSVDSSPATLSFRDITFLGPFLEPLLKPIVTLENLIRNNGGTGTVSIDDFFAGLDVTTKDDLTDVTIIQPSSLTTITTTETEINNHIFDGDFPVTDTFTSQSESETELCDPDAIVCYTPDPRTSAIAQIEIP